jgi:hypothetical protein
MTISNTFVVIAALAFFGLMLISLVSSVGLVSMRGAALLAVLFAAVGYFFFAVMTSTAPELFAVLPGLLG